jgi:hypothetical protein
MMTLRALIEKNKNWLRFYSILASIIGWLTIVWGAVHLMLVARYPLYGVGEQRFGQIFWWSEVTVIHQMFFGVIVLLAAQYLDFLLSSNNEEPKWLLKNGEKILYFFVIFGVCSFVMGQCLAEYPTGGRTWVSFLNNASPFSFLGARVLVFIALAQTLRRTLPIIEESKLLV